MTTSHPYTTTRRHHICIVAQNAFGALVNAPNRHIGGAEIQTTSLARWLAARGYKVSLVTWDEGQQDELLVDGIRVLKMCREDAGLPGVRFFLPRMQSLWSAVRRADADVYYHNSAEHVTGLLAWWCRRNGRKLVYSVASDVACDRHLPALKKRHERVLYRYGVQHAHKVIVQTERQQTMLREGFGTPSVVLPMPCRGPSQEQFETQPEPTLDSVAWVGRADHMKRLEWILDIAERMPEVRFHVAIASLLRYPTAETVRARAAALPNVMLRHNVERSAIADIYRTTACLCCTSTYEGFPNTFLEAWSHGRPVVTSFDPDGIVARESLGAVASTVPDFVRELRGLFASRERWRVASANARRYYVQRHTPERAMPMLEGQMFPVRNSTFAARSFAPPKIVQQVEHLGCDL